MILRNINYRSITVLLGTLASFYMMSCKAKSAANMHSDQNQQVDTMPVKETKVNENFYPQLRAKSLSVTPDQLKLKLDNNKTIAYGIVMDWDLGQAVATVVAFQSGDASLYISAGQVYIGGYAHENIRDAGSAFVNEAQAYLGRAQLTESTELPDKDCVKFYILTNKGRYTFQETVNNITTNNSEWTKLFNLGNNVISEYRKTTDKSNNK